MRPLRFLSVRGRGGGDEQTARRFAGPEDGSGVAQSSDRARLRESMRMGRTEGEPVRWCVLFEGSNLLQVARRMSQGPPSSHLAVDSRARADT
jgi:hypothetical protein